MEMNNMNKFKAALVKLENNIDAVGEQFTPAQRAALGFRDAHHAADFARVNAWMVKEERRKTRNALIIASVAAGMIFAALVTIDPIGKLAEYNFQIEEPKP